MSHDFSSPAPSSQPIVLHQDRGPGMPMLPSPGLAAMTRRYMNGEVDLRELLAFNGTGRAERLQRPY